jgi:hypothetical protein
MVLFLDPHYIFLASFFSFFTTIGIGRPLALRNAQPSPPLRSLRILAWSAIVSSVLFGVCGLLPSNTDQDIQHVLLALAAVSIFPQFLIYKVREVELEHHLGRNNPRVMTIMLPHLKKREVRLNQPELFIEAIGWLVTCLIFQHRGEFPPVAGMLWNIGGGIAMARTFDIFAAVGIGIHPKIRRAFLWATRVCLTAGLLIGVISLISHLK